MILAFSLPQKSRLPTPMVHRSSMVRCFAFQRLMLAEKNYSLDLALISGDPITFRLSDYDEVAAPKPSALARATTLFGDSIETQIVQAKCTVCHKEGLIASNSGLLFVSAGGSSAVTNLGAFAIYLNGSEAARTRILSMVTGVGHSGGKQMEVGSDLHQNLGEMLRLLLEHQAGI